ncbi:MAG: hypothetical protein BAJATHORv1_30390 [Candidatus Thorarchaeota archaeon]|nr:MAG: hypothetical protein BAJATHORv1_30390 [Candidatus Thorarchaeota archaeon]
MVRELKIGLAHMKEASGDKELPRERSYVTSLMLAEHEKGGSSIESISVVGLPFWIVQTSSSTSVILAPSRESGIELSYSEGSHIAEVRRILRSKVTEPETVKEATDKIISTIAKPATKTTKISGMLDPAVFVEVADYVNTASIEERVPLIEGSISSQDALSASEKFQEIRDALKMRVDELESLRKLANEILGGQLSVIKNIIATEQRRYKPQLESMEEKTDLEIEQLEKKKNEKLYSLGESHMMSLRSKSVTFSRELSNIEKVLDVMVNLTKDARVDISKKGHKVREGIERFKELSKSIKEYQESIPDILNDLDAESQRVLDEAKILEEEHLQKRADIELEFEEDVKAKQERLEQFKQDMETKLADLRETEKIVTESVERVDEALGEQIIQLQSDLLSITGKSLDNRDIPEVAPLTRLTLHCVVLTSGGNTKKILLPYSVPDERLDSTLGYQSISRKLEDKLMSEIEIWRSEDSAFASHLDRAIQEGNIFEMDNIDKLFQEGLDKLQMTQHLKDGVKDKIETLWKSYSKTS